MADGMPDRPKPPLSQPALGLRAGNRALSVTDQIREAILGGSIGAGERLNEVRLSKTLAVSRTPVRAALQALAGQRPLEYPPQRGFHGPEFPPSAIVHSYHIPASLERLPAPLAPARRF